MLSRRAPDTRFILLLIVLLFLAGVAVWWSLRAGRVSAATDPGPLPGTASPAPVGAAPTAAPATP